MQLRTRTTGFVRTEGGLLPPDLLERVRALDRALPGLDEAAYGLEKPERFGEGITRSWLRLQGAWASFLDDLPNVPPSDPATTTTRERFLLPLMEELGYGRLTPVRSIELDGKTYPVSHAYADLVPLHLVGANVPLDRRSRGIAGAAGQSPHGLVQELLNRSPDRLWGIVTNGKTLRILRDNASLTRQAYVEFDLEAIFTGEAYADFALLWHLAHRTRLEPRLPDKADEGATPRVDACYLEAWSKVAEQTGARARDRLRDGVQEAISALGSGFLKHPANGDLRTALQVGELTTQDYYRELLRLVYRLILLFVAEDRELLLDPEAPPTVRERYSRYYSTARLRRLADRRKGSRHADLYAGFRVVVTALGRDEGAPAIGLPPLGGFLFGPEACPHLDRAELANADLLDAIRRLATIEEKGVRRVVDYRNLGSEELGSIYESLLELHPELDTAAGTFALRTAAGHERKTTGSYYTPSSLIKVILDSALDPVLDEIATKPTKEEAERAILEMSVVDPAAGSGHFLVAAAHRIAKRLAQVRTGDEEPAPDATRTALRDVIGHCLYAVDINPMAVELCKVSLWLEALEPGKPLTFLDHHIKCGNSLLGTTLDLIGRGIPDGAYDALTGDDGAVARSLRTLNANERRGQETLWGGGKPLSTDALVAALLGLEAANDSTIDGVRSMEAQLAAIASSDSYGKLRLAADTWTAAFVLPKVPTAPHLTSAGLRAVAGDPGALQPETHAAVAAEAATFRFFHWEIEYPHVRRRGGFDVVVGNPPWERVKLQEKEFFAERAPYIARARNAAERKRQIATLRQTDPILYAEFNRALRQADAESHLIRNSGRYPLTGRGDINTYPAFAEMCRSILSPRGRAGLVLPTGIATDDTTKTFFGDLVASRSLVSVYGFENEEFIFPAVHHATKFCLLTVAGLESPVDVADFVFFARQATDLYDSARHFELTSDDFALLNPNTRTCPTFRSRQDAGYTLEVYRRLPILVRDEPPLNPWEITMGEMVHMANDSAAFEDRPRSAAVPLYEAKMFSVLDHRYGTYEGQSVSQARQGTLPRLTEDEKRDPAATVRPQYWFPSAELDARLSDWDEDWLLAWRKITNSVAWRTFVPTALPRVAVANSAITGLPRRGPVACLLGNLASLAFDYVTRQKLGGSNMAGYVVKQLPVLPPGHYDRPAPWDAVLLGDWVRRYVVELAVTSNDLSAFGESAGWQGPPFEWSSHRRELLFAELDAAYLVLYGFDLAAAEHILDSFWIIADRETSVHGHFRTKTLVLRAMERMMRASSSAPFETDLSPAAGDPRATSTGDPMRPDLWRPYSEIVHTSSLSVAPSSVPPQPIAPNRSVTSVNNEPRGTARHSDVADPGMGSGSASTWWSEATVEPGRLILGIKARHRLFGEGVVLAIRQLGSSSSVLVRFPHGEREIEMGRGFLEFET